MAENLLPCPFCGGESFLYGADAVFWIGCLKCRVNTPIFESEEKAIAAWNRRADARQHALKTGVCPMCEDCPDGCPVEIPRDSRNIVTTNADRIRSMSDEELVDWIDSMLNEDRDDWDAPGCYSCINYGTHHSDPQNKGTNLYECAGCSHEGSHENGLKHGVLMWLRQPVKEE